MGRCTFSNSTRYRQKKSLSWAIRPIGRGGADLRFLSPQPDASLHCQTTDTGLVHRTVCLFTSQLSPALTAPNTEGWPGWVDLGGWLHTEMAGSPICWRSPILVLTGPSVDQLPWCDQWRYQLSRTAASTRHQVYPYSKWIATLVEKSWIHNTENIRIARKKSNQ